MTGDNKNFIVAIALSVAVILGWQVFYAQPKLEHDRAVQVQQQAPQQQPQPDAAVPQAPVPGAGPAPQPLPQQVPSATLPRDTVLAQTPRVPIETASLAGSINLTGGRIDDLKLTRYHETVDPRSPVITLLSPAGSPGAFFADYGWTAGAGASVRTPDPQTVWSAPGGARLTPATPVTLTWDNGEGLTFRRIVAVDERYMFSVRQEVDNATGAAVSLHPYARVQRIGTPPVAGIFVLHEGLLGVLEDELIEETYDDVRDFTQPLSRTSTGGWLGITDKYWALAIVPDQALRVIGTMRHHQAGSDDLYQVDWLAGDPMIVAPGATVAVDSQVFAGAKVVETISRYHDTGINRFDLMIDWGWFYFITKPLFWALHYINQVVHNFGVAILIVTVLLKLLFFPLQNKSYASMSKMKKLAPEMEAIKKRHPDDRMKQQQAMMELYKKEQVSPLSGCLPIVIQIPVFFALYKVIYTTIEMRHAPFFGWIRDLSAPDPTTLFNLFGLLPFTPPQFLMLGVLPILMGITMWIQMRLNPTPPDPVQAQIFNWMPLIFTFLLASFPAGLVLYWTWNNFLSILQQAYIMRKNGVEINLLGNIRSSLGLGGGKSAG